MVTHTSNSPGETEALGEAWGREARGDWVIGLCGDLGAGKTRLVQGLARGLGVRGRIQSPTFGLVCEHDDGRLPLRHIDLYRLEDRREIVGAGLEGYLVRPVGVVVVEWIERWLGDEAIPVVMKGVCYRHVTITAMGEHVRVIRYEDFGA